MIRLEYSEDGVFEDRATQFAFYRENVYESYEVKNQFMFGTELLVAPITSKRIPGLNVAEVKVWLPEGSVIKEIKIRIDKKLIKLENNVKEACFKFLNQAEIEFFLKDQIYALIQKENRLSVLIFQLHAMNLEEKLLEALVEMITAKTKFSSFY